MPKKDYTKRSESEYNIFRTFFQWAVTGVGYMFRLKLVYRLKVEGLENVPKTNDYIVCANHLSTMDPPMLAGIMPRRVAYMAKKELFENPFMRWWLDWLGAFAVNRKSLGVSTIKTARSIKNTDWVLGIFPQGTRQEPGTISCISKGFAGLAKATKCNILPIGILGTNEIKHLPFSGKITVKIGEVIPYSDDVEEMVAKWVEAIQELTGFKYVPVLE
ncbi:MAG: 1-acyl-sn-glycerol-3-phosphate acyltransferase [Heliobacteriaceae bacterium]|jgi:1-acyl-sn-glycerol-3-phosphate acyltransferase|nr:1-acyl-sn-glycerol-3-phosphate acyltransferase [Heliobacteriaceae bacterium]